MLITSAIFFTGGAPNSLIALLVIPYIIYRLMNPELKRTPEAPVIARQKLAKMGPMSAGEKGMTAVFLLTLLLWATGQWTHIDATAVALGGVGALLIANIINWKSTPKKSPARFM